MTLSTRTIFVLFGAFASVSSFAPAHNHVSVAVRSPIVLDTAKRPVDEERTSKRTRTSNRILKKAGKIAGAAASIALATSSMPPAAIAWRKAKTVESTFNVADAVRSLTDAFEAADTTKKVAMVGAGAFVAGAGTNAILRPIIKFITSSPFKYSLETNFPKARKSESLVKNVRSALRKHKFRKKNTLVATSFCADEVNRGLERKFVEVYGDNYSFGGLAGFPFGGISAFGAMASNIPDGGSCLIVFGPHVGMDSKGTIGSVRRRGKKGNEPCCRPAIAAAGYAHAVYHGLASPYVPPDVPDDAQQNFVGTALLPYAGYVEAATDRMAELPYALFDAQKKMMGTLLQAGAGNVPGKIAVLGGIQINTQAGKSDYFLPLSFELYDSSGTMVKDLRSTIDCGRAHDYVSTSTSVTRASSLPV